MPRQLQGVAASPGTSCEGMAAVSLGQSQPQRLQMIDGGLVGSNIGAHSGPEAAIDRS